MKNLATIPGVHASEQLLHAFCHLCGRWRILDADEVIRDRRGHMMLPITAECPDCGEPGLVRVRPIHFRANVDAMDHDAAREELPATQADVRAGT